MNADGFMITLRLLHLFGAFMWAGSAIFMDRFLLPAVGASGPAGAKATRALMKQTPFMMALPVSIAVTLIAGLLMYARHAMSNPTFLGSWTGRIYGLGAVLAILAGVLGGHVNMKRVRAILAIGDAVEAAGGPPTAEQAAQLGALSKQMAVTLRHIVYLLVGALAAMVSARHVYG